MYNRIHRIEGTFEHSEDWLQRYLATHAELLPTRDLEGISSKLRLIGRELGGMDLLFMDERGLLTVVETKLAENPEARREVVSQLLDYAAQLAKLDVVELCRLIGSMSGSKAIQGLAPLQELSKVLHRRLVSGSPGSEAEEAAKAALASYVLHNQVSESAEFSQIDQSFLRRVDSMLAEGSFRLMAVTYEVSQKLLDLLNYTNATARRGRQLVAVELSIQDLEGGRYFVPHLVGAPSLLSPAYYREEKAGERLYRDWTTESLVERLPNDLMADISRLVDAVKERADRLCLDTGTAERGSLLFGAQVLEKQRCNTLVAIWVDGQATLYFSHAQSTLPEDQRNKVVDLIGSRSFLKEAHKKIIDGLKKGTRHEPPFDLRACGEEGERWKVVLQLLEDFFTAINT